MYAVIFQSTRTDHHDDLYNEWSQRMEDEVKEVDGYINHIGFRDPITRKGVTIAYFESEDAIKRWKNSPDHITAQELGREHFYEDYSVEVALIERSYEWA